MTAAVMAALMSWSTVPARDLTNWIRPAGFMSPDLRAGQYSIGASIELNGSEGRYDSRQDDGEHVYGSRITHDEWNLLSHGMYALTDQWVISGSLRFAPGQKSDDFNSQTGGLFSAQTHERSELDHRFGTSLTVAFKPTAMFELFVSGFYSRQMQDGADTGSTPAHRGSFNESYNLVIGFNMAR
jgi:hypothetical protein